MEITVKSFDSAEESLAYLCDQAAAVLTEETDLTAGLANVSAVIRLLMPELNWAGFYLLKGGGLVLGPFQGKPAVSRIALGSGVCGTAAQTGRAQLVTDVHQCCNHIACDLASSSELVLPLYANGALYGVLDLDSPRVGRFGDTELQGLQPLAELIGRWISRIGA